MWHFSFRDSAWSQLHSPEGQPRPPPGWGHRLVLTQQETDGHLTLWMFGGYNETTGINELWSLDWETRAWTLHGFNGRAFTRGAQTLRQALSSDALVVDDASTSVDTTGAKADDATDTPVDTAPPLDTAPLDATTSLDDDDDAAVPSDGEVDDGLPAGAWYRAPSREAAWPAARKGHSLTLFQGHLVLFGGHGRMDFMGDVWLYRIADGEWIGPVPCANPPPPRNFHATAVLGDKQYVFGGNNVNGLLSDFWKLHLSKVVQYSITKRP